MITKRVKTFCDLTILWFLNNRLAQGFGGFYPHSPIFKPPQFYAGKPVGAPAKRFPRPRYKRVLAAQARAGKKRFRELSGAVRLKRFFVCLHRTFIMKNQLKKLGMAAVVVALPAVSFAADSIDPAPLVDGISAGKPVILAVGAAIFGLIGILVALNFGKKASRG